jgi:hypothetical protein
MVDLYWLPLGAGGHFVRFNGRVYEAVVAGMARRPRLALYHSALIAGGHVIEVGPVGPAGRGAVAGGAVGTRLAGRLKLFRYEVRSWRGGAIPDVAEAVDSPRRVDVDAARVLALVPVVPRPVWGRDELHAGEMWNSNSVIAWLLVRAGADVAAIQPPAGGRAPGWDAGLVVAGRT